MCKAVLIIDVILRITEEKEQTGFFTKSKQDLLMRVCEDSDINCHMVHYS